jgi:putative aldouronate transport system permease protein
VRKILRSERLPLHIMLLPSLAILAVYSYWPMAGIMIAFEKYIPTKGTFGSPWVGWRNFEYLFELPDTKRVIINTLLIASMKVIVGLIVPLVVSLLLNEVRKNAFKRMVQTLVYLPHFLSWVILGGILIDLLSPSNGIVNQILVMFGIKPIYFLGENSWFRFVLVSSDVWKEFGFNTIVYLAALTGINPSLYEAADIDGANRLQQTWYVTLPGIMPIAILMVTLSIGNILNAGFDQIFNLYSSPVYESGDIIDTLVYRLGILQAQYGLATAVGLLKSTVSLFLISSSYYLAYRFANYRIF